MTIEELKEKSEIELKALAYDALGQIEASQQLLKVIAQILQEKAKEKNVC